MRVAITAGWLLSMAFGVWAVKSLPSATTAVIVLAPTSEPPAAIPAPTAQRAAPAPTLHVDVSVDALVQLVTPTATRAPRVTPAVCADVPVAPCRVPTPDYPETESMQESDAG